MFLNCFWGAAVLLIISRTCTGVIAVAAQIGFIILAIIASLVEKNIGILPRTACVLSAIQEIIDLLSNYSK